ncbi:hypothetical protein WJX73_000238 [Symbiochloris irregularis]|uniref:Uncharacterized protein n=1 Tax=Symbiochloris irregularis TaxID=706552 RepID=A0AAW1P2C8_9CHLO
MRQGRHSRDLVREVLAEADLAKGSDMKAYNNRLGKLETERGPVIENLLAIACEKMKTGPLHPSQTCTPPAQLLWLMAGLPRGHRSELSFCGQQAASAAGRHGAAPPLASGYLEIWGRFGQNLWEGGPLLAPVWRASKASADAWAQDPNAASLAELIAAVAAMRKTFDACCPRNRQQIQGSKSFAMGIMTSQCGEIKASATKVPQARAQLRLRLGTGFVAGWDSSARLETLAQHVVGQAAREPLRLHSSAQEGKFGRMGASSLCSGCSA